MEKRVLIAFALSIAVFVIWSYLFGPQPKQTTPTLTETTQETAPASEKAAPVTRTGKSEPQARTATAATQAHDVSPGKEITVKTDLYTAKISENGGRLTSLTLNRYRTKADPDSPPKELVTVDSPGDYPLQTYFLSGSVPGLGNARFSTDKEAINLAAKARPERLTLTYKEESGLEVTKVYTFHPDSYLIDLEVILRNFSEQTIDDNLVLELTSGPFKRKRRYSFAGLGMLLGDNLHEIKLDKLEKGMAKVQETPYSLTWAGYEDQYFLAVALPENRDKTKVKAARLGETGLRLDLINPPVILAPHTEKTYRYTLYYGPKDYNLLKSLNNQLERSIYFGWFDVLAKPILVSMLWLHQYVKNYGVTIIILTIIIKIIFWPLTHKSHKSMKEMQKIQPRITKLREKYKNDKQAMNREMMQLYRTYKINPMGGCLPIAIQIPVFIALYRILDYSLELRHAPFWLWIQDLSAPDRLFEFAFKVPFMQEPYGIPILTVLMGATMFLQQKMQPMPGDPTQAKMMMFMPLFFTFIFINFPSGLVLYWLVNNILTIGQQVFTNKISS
ncbi:MAG: membrane protein insertase YidC [Deltaproteobacteria bacterium]|nr:membrane protein insertase YidC [Deltaproteobacteria bacterium]MBW2050986.1 membrane protein insertase YidC [Deltaproteobacteria bacterium]MBW2141752.1 membrane protein insertase YidC [Deltaproteobacteria bacterium]MBW2323850.1 membrane protein insertase YidC [Deltaproteobacteria bacterium]